MEVTLIVKKGLNLGHEIQIEQFPAIFGSEQENTFAFNEEGVAPQHFIINQKENKIIVRVFDHAQISINGVVVKRAELNNMDYIGVGKNLVLEVYLHNKKKTTKIQTYSEIKMEPGGVLRRRIDIDKISILEPSTQKLQYSYRALKTIYEVLRKCNNESNDGLLFDRLLDSLFKAIDAERGAIFLKSDKNQYEGKAFLTSYGDRKVFPVSSTILKDVIKNRVSIISYMDDQDRRSSSESIRMQMVGSFICTPLISYEKVFGALYLDRTLFHNQPQLVEEDGGEIYPNPFIIEDLELLVAIGIQIGGTLAKSLLLRKVRKSLWEKEKLLQALRESEERYALAARAANDGLWDCDLQTQKVYYSTRWKGMLGYKDDQILSSLDEWFQRIHEEDFERVKKEFDEHLKGAIPHFQVEHRMLHANGNYIWVLNQGIAVRDFQSNAIRIVGSQTDITKRKQAETQLLHDAFYDPLTDLPNRALFISRLQRALYRLNRNPNYLFAVLFMDLDSFKVVNDSMGHVTGDELLVSIGKRLQDAVRATDTVARFGGDEFTVLLENIDNVKHASEIAQLLHDKLSAPFTLNEQDFFMGASIGIAIGSANYSEPQELLRDADTAMYRAKSLGKQCEIFDRQMHESVLSLLRMETDLRKSLVEKDFYLCYQPIVNLENFKISGFESLIRWNHQERGVISPGEFIPLAERTRLIIDIGWWSIREACHQVNTWQKQFSSPLSISVNMSAKQFALHDLAKRLNNIIEETKVSPHSLKLEITETMLMENAKSMVKMLTRLKSMNIDLYIDDFGTGYSSLSYLHQFPISTLKVDRSFIMDITKKENFEIVRTIITLAHNLGMNVVAEGIETPEQLDLLKKLNCNYGQGNLFSPPVKNVHIDSLLSSSSPWDFL